MTPASAMTMHKKPRRTLVKLLADYGDELIHDPRRTEALLNDLCGKYTREIFVLVQAQRKRVPAELRAAPKWIPVGTTVNRLVSVLENQLALTPEAAAWAVESWAIALDLVQEDAPDPWYSRISGTLLGRERSAAQSPQQSPQPSAPPSDKPAQTNGGGIPFGFGRGPTPPSTAPPRSGGNSAAPRQNPPSVVQSSQASVDAGAAPRRRPGRSATRRNFLGFPAYLRKQAPNALLWSAVLLISILLGWAVWDGMALSGTLAWTDVPASSSAQPDPTIDSDTARTALLEHYTPPQNATVIAADGLFRRAGPSTAETGLGLLTAGQIVTVVAYSADGRWAELSGAAPGWVSTEYLLFTLSDGREIRLSPRSGRVQPQLETVALQSEPLQQAPPVGNLRGGDEIQVVAVTADDNWLHIVSPTSGWLMRSAVELDPAARKTEPPTAHTQARSPGT